MAKNIQKQTNKTHLESHTAKIMVACIVLVMAISMVSAFEFDNRKEIVNEKGLAGYDNIKIGNFFGLGKTLWEGTLEKNTESCGTECSAETTIILYETGSLIDEVIFKTLQDDGSWKEQGIRNYQFLIKIGDEEYDVDDYEWTCTPTGKKDINGTDEVNCESKLVGSHKESRKLWEDYTMGTEVSTGTYEIKLVGEKKATRTVDWQITSQGVLIDEWAVWGGGDFPDGIIAYYNMSDGSGTVRDETGNYDLIENVEMGYGYNGLIGNALYFNDDSGYINDSTPDLLENGTISFWVRYNVTLDGVIMAKPSNGIKKRAFGLHLGNWLADGFRIRLEYDNDASALKVLYSDILTVDNWYHIVMTWNLTTTELYTDGVSNGKNISNGVDGFKNMTKWNIGSEDGGTVTGTNGTIDEFGVWNRSLTANEVSLLYNSGSGIPFGKGSFITLNSPVDNFNTLNNVIFNCSAKVVGGALLSNISLWDNSSGVFEIKQTNSTVSNSTNITLFNAGFSPGNYLWNCGGCDSDGDCGFASTNRTIVSNRIIVVDETFVASTTSGATNTFLIELETNGDIITVGNLNYNGTNGLGSITSSGNFYNLTRDQVAVSVSSITNVSFFWNATFNDGTYHAISPKNQTVSQISINQTCTGDMFVIYNFTQFDETTQVKIDAVKNATIVKVTLNLFNLNKDTLISEFDFQYNSINPVEICIDNDLSGGEQYSLDLQVEYSGTDYSTEFYNIESKQLNTSSISNNISLYNLETEDTQAFRLRVRDTSFLPINGALIQIERKYIENGTFFITEIPKADEDGISSASLQTDNVIYNFKIYDSGTLVSTFNNVLAICQTPLVSTCEIDFNAFQSQITIPDYEEGDDFDFTLGYNDTSKIVDSQFTVPSGEPSTVQLVVTREDSLGTAVCTDSLTSASGTLSCTIPNSFGNSTVLAKLYKDGVEQGKGNIKTDQQSKDIFPGVLVLLSVLVMITLIGMGVSDNPIVTAIFLFVGVVVLFGINLIQNTGFVGATATILFFLIAIILVIIKAARRS